MSRQGWVVAYRVIFAAAALFAVGYQYVDGAENSATFTPGNFWSFFTVQANVFASLVLLAAAWWERKPRAPAGFHLVRGAAVVYLATTGVVYGLLLSGYQEALQTTLPWVDTVLHRVMPIVMVADWLIDPPERRIELREAAIWLLYPFAYMIYSLVRGSIVDWYPYPFLNPSNPGGYGAVALYAVGIAAGVGVFAWIVVALSRRANTPVSAS